MAFYQCPRCKRVWQYPIKKCPYCFLNLEKLDSKEIKVIGVSKVNIPTILHPQIPYYVLLLEDDKGNRWVHKSVRKYEIGDKFETDTSSNDNSVAIFRVKYDISVAIEQTIKALGGLKINAEKNILILPTLVSPKRPHLSENTAPRFLEAVISYLISQGLEKGKIKVANQSFNEFSVEASAFKSGLLGVCQKFAIEPLDLAKGGFVKKESGGMSFEISKEALNSYIINLPILKAGKAQASENIFKLLGKENYLGLRYFSKKREIFDNLKNLLPNFITLAQADRVQREDGFTVFLGLVLGSFHSLNLDRVFAEITNKGNLPEMVKDIKMENIPLLGRKVEEVSFELYQ